MKRQPIPTIDTPFTKPTKNELTNAFGVSIPDDDVKTLKTVDPRLYELAKGLFG